MNDSELIELANVQLVAWQRDDHVWGSLKRHRDTFDRQTGAVVAEGAPQKTMQNVQRIIEHDPYWAGRIWWDDLYRQVRVNMDGVDLLVNDAIEAEVGLQICNVYNLAMEPRVIGAALQWLARKNTRHPVREWLRTLQWDGVPRLWTWTRDYLNSTDEPIVMEMGARWLIQCVARAMDPGCKADTMLILHGLQGAKKSTAIKHLAMPWYRDSEVPFRSKDKYTILQGAWIYEIPELDSFKAADIRSLKAYVTSSTDSFRPPYGRNTEDYPRSTVFAGSTNDDQFLTDPTGSRRFWVIKVGRTDYERIEQDREQLFAEALVAYLRSEPWWLSPESETKRAENNESFQVDDPLFARFQTWSKHRTDLTAAEFLDVISPGKMPTIADAHRIADIVQKDGTFKAGRIYRDGVRVRGYCRKNDGSKADDAVPAKQLEPIY